jgi:hypothetical protein
LTRGFPVHLREIYWGKIGLRYFPKEFWASLQKTVEEVELFEIKLKLREQLRPNWQQMGEEVFRELGKAKDPVVFILDEFPMMIATMARSSAHRDEAKTLLRWLRSLRQGSHMDNVRFLIAGSIGIDRVLNELGEITAINDFEQVTLYPFPPKLAAQFLKDLAATHPVPLSAASEGP